MHKLENSFLKIKAREYGAELTSVFDKQHNIEHLWQADPKFWEWHAPVLFPVVGRCLNDEIIIDGRNYEMQKHGFARKSEFKLLDLNENRMIFSLKSNEELLKVYPYNFEFLVGYRLNLSSLVVSYEVINRDNKDIYFQLGGHPAFAAPFMPNEDYHDYYLEFEEIEDASRYYINDSGYFDGRKDVSLSNSNTIALKNGLFKDDALIFKHLKSRKVSIKSKNHNHFLSVNFKGFNYLGVWAKVGAPYVCIEPWLGCADTADKPVEFKNKEGVVMLAPATSFSVSFNIEMG